MTKPKEASKQGFYLDWKSAGIGIGIGMLLLFLIIVKGGRVEEWNFGIAKVVFPTPTSAAATTAPRSQPAASGVESSAPDLYAHLISVGFMLDDWGPSQLDLRTAPTVGILLKPSNSLRFFDMQVSAPDAFVDLYKVQAEVRANDSETIGRTGMVQLSPQTTDLGGVVPTSYQHQSIKDNWAVQPEWKELTVVVSLYDKSNNIVGSEKTHIQITQTTNKSWWITPPYGKFVFIVYQVNNGPSTTMDLRTIETDGLNVKPGDHLSIREMWYHSLEYDDTKQIFAYVYFSPGPPETMPVRHTQPMNIQFGVHDLVQDNSLQWDIDSAQTAITFDLYRSEGHETEVLARSVFLDRYVIPLKPGSMNGLFPLPSP